jgi:nitrogen regulatory protein PII
MKFSRKPNNDLAICIKVTENAKAYIKQHKPDEVVHKLQESGVVDISIVQIQTVGWHKADWYGSEDLDKRYHYNEIFKLEIICLASDADKFVKIIQQHAYTGTPGDGLIFVSDVEQAIKIRTGETGRKALQ